MPTVFRPRRGRRLGILFTGLLLAAVAALTAALTVVAALDPKTAGAAWITGAATIVVGGMAWWLVGLFVKLGRAHVTISDDRLELFVHRYSVWGPIRLGEAKLAWNEVRGVEFWTAWSRLAPDGVLRTLRLHTERGKFEMTNIYWPDVEQIANEVSERSEQAKNKDAVAPAMANKPADPQSTPGEQGARSFSVSFVHAFAWLSVVAGVGLAALILLGQLGGAGLSLREIATVLAMGTALVGIGLRLRQYPFEPQPSAR